MKGLMLGALLCAAPVTTTFADALQELGAPSDLRFDGDGARLAVAQRAAQAAAGGEGAKPAAEPGSEGNAEGAPEATSRYLQPGRWWGGVIGGYARGLSDDSNDYNLAFTLSTFLIERFELLMEFGGWWFDQPGDDALGINWNLIFRFHVLTFGDRDEWTVFLEGGAGVLGTTDNVPEGGTGFNFTPRAGGGFTRALGDSEARFVMGVRWHHISNARINGDDRNPGRDGINVYAGVVFPF